MQRSEPVLDAYFESVQLEHIEDPNPVLYVPIAQFAHDGLATRLFMVPGSQFQHTDLAYCANVPTMHPVHTVAPEPELNVPLSQNSHRTAPAKELKNPGSQIAHEDGLVGFTNSQVRMVGKVAVPRAHAVQTVAPITLENVPSPQDVHDRAPAFALNLPISQFTHTPDDWYLPAGH
jgi:hypothetical protein